MMKRFCAAFLGLTATLTIAPASAAETATIAGSRAVLIKPASPQASVILMPGSDGAIQAGSHGDIHGLNGNQLVPLPAMPMPARGLAVLVVDVSTDLRSAVDYMAAIKRPVTVIATSAGTWRAAEGIARGAKPDALVLISGILSPESGPASSNVEAILGSPSALPPTLVIHHRYDGCNLTRPAGVAPFIKWAGGRARVSWLLGGVNEGNPCYADAYHGFNGLDEQVVELVAGFR